MKPQIPMKDGKPVHPIKADTLKPVLEKYKSAGKAVQYGDDFSGRHTQYEIALLAGGRRH